MMDQTEIHLRFGVASYETPDLSDDQPSFRFGIQTVETPSDNESDISSDVSVSGNYSQEVSDDEKVDLKKLVDPGPFRYDKRVAVAALPCILLLLALGGEMVLIIATLGSAFLILLDHEGEKRKCVVVFGLMFIPCHLYFIVTVIPLLWLSLWNFFLIIALNGGFLLTGSWILLHFVSFRMEEPVFCQIVEQMLFTAYPSISVFLICWVLSTVLPLAVIPLIGLLLGFMMLQVFLTPVVSSFKLKPDVDEDMNVVQQPIMIVIILILLLCPSLLHVLFALLAPSTQNLFTSKSMIELIFLLFLSIFLVSLLSIRQIMDDLGVQFAVVVKLRYLGGVVASLLCYPVLQAFGLTSHFLPWLPIAIVGFSVLGIILSMKNYKGAALALMTSLAVLLLYWISTLPWQLQYNFLNSIPIQYFYCLIVINFMLCLMCLYASTYCRQEIFGLLTCIESLVLLLCEVCLQKSDLTRLPVIQATGLTAIYMFYRLYSADKLSQNSALFSASLHVTKVTSGVLSQIVPNQEDTTLLSCVMLFGFMYMCLKMFIFDKRIDITQTQTLSGLCLLLLTLACNYQTVLSTIGYLLWQEQPSPTLLIGLWLLIGGLLVLLFSQFHPQPELDADMKKAGISMLLTSIVVFAVQPDLGFSLLSMFQWCELISVLLLASVLVTKLALSVKLITCISTVVSICPGVRISILLYGDQIVNMVPCLLYILLVTIAICLLICYIKIESFTESIEKFIRNLCLIEGCLMLVLLMYDYSALPQVVSFFSLPAWWGVLGALVFTCVILKLLSYKKVQGILPTSNKSEEKVIPILPVIGNVMCFCSFLLLCIQGPADGFLHDMWCCGASLIFFCLQRDVFWFQNLREFNQATPTSVAAILVLLMATVLRNWAYETTSMTRQLLRCLELISLPLTLPIYVVLWFIMWRHEILSEKAVVFCVPLNLVLFLAASSYTAWILSVTGVSVGIHMMCFRLPMIPYSGQEHYGK